MNTECPHKDVKHYAKGMCNNCYHTQGRKKLAWNCEHKGQISFAKGLCGDCHKNYTNKNATDKRDAEEEIQAEVQKIEDVYLSEE